MSVLRAAPFKSSGSDCKICSLRVAFENCTGVLIKLAGLVPGVAGTDSVALQHLSTYIVPMLL